MREIKFRAWDGRRMIDPVWTWKGQSPLTQAGKPHSQFYNNFHEKWMLGIEQDAIVLMQFTGLKDANKKEIWEGDIVSVPTSRGDEKAVIFWGQYAWCLDWGGGKGDELSAIGADIIEVVGNIYETPELLK